MNGSEEGGGDLVRHPSSLPAATTGPTPPSSAVCTRFFGTYAMLLEGDAGVPVLLSTFTSFDSFAGQTQGAVAAAQVLTGADEPGEGVGLANTNLVVLGDRLCLGQRR